jgi:hypothetical protein
MLATRSFPRLLLVAAPLIGYLFMSGPARVAATTGSTYALPPSRYKVPGTLLPLYRGRYSLQSVGKGARISEAQGFITVNQYHDLYGAAVFYGYDTHGFKASWIGTFYDFHLAAHGVMVINVYGWGGAPLGTLFVTRTKRGDLVGHIQMVGGQKYPIAWRKDTNKT